MLIYLLRHGLTQDNQEKRYQGRRDVPLCPQGLAQLRRADFAPKTVMITSAPRPPPPVNLPHCGTHMLVLYIPAGTQYHLLPLRYPSAGGFVLDAADWVHQKNLRVAKTVQYTKELPC